MKEERYEQINPLEDINDNTCNKTKNINFKLIIIIILIILFLFGLGIIVYILIDQSKKITDLTNQIENLSNKNKHDISSINDKINNNISNLEIEINKKEKEIQLLKINLQKKDKEIQLYNQEINKLKILVNNSLIYYDNSLNENNKEIQLLKINLQKKDNEIQLSNQEIDNLKILVNNSLIYYDNSLNENNKEIQVLKIALLESLDNFENILKEKNKQNSNSLDIINEKLNRNFLDIQRVKQLESNIALLLNFKVRIKADFYIDNRQVHLCSHKYHDSDRIDDSRIKLSVNREGINGCIWKVYQNGNSLGFKLFDSLYGMNEWTIKIRNNVPICVNEGVSYIFSLEEGGYYKSYRIKNKETGEYLYINTNKKRDHISYFIDLTSSKSEATDFYFSLYNE